MFYTGLDPTTMKPVYVPRSPEEKAMQRALLQYYEPKNRELVRKALIKAGRQDLMATLSAGGPREPQAASRRDDRPRPTAKQRKAKRK
jgi:hypothetical protein